MEEALKAEIDLLVACERYERTEKRRNYRNGPYVRQLISHHGLLAGVSTRKMGVVLEYLLGTRVSAQTVSCITQQLDREVKIFRTRELEDDYRYLFLDGIVQSEQVVGSTMKGPLLVAYGIRYDGTREIIAYMKAKSESEAAWEGFLEDLYRRGLIGDRLLVHFSMPVAHRKTVRTTNPIERLFREVR